MKIEDFKEGEDYIYDGQYKEKVLHVIHQQKRIVTINPQGEVWVVEENEFNDFESIKEEETTLELVSKAVQEIGNFTIEQTKSGVIILNKIEK